jgi:hypothetical protein
VLERKNFSSEVTWVSSAMTPGTESLEYIIDAGELFTADDDDGRVVEREAKGRDHCELRASLGAGRLLLTLSGRAAHSPP